METWYYSALMFDATALPNGHRIILLYRWDESDPPLSLENTNHNVFRLDKDNNVVWQVRRVENPTHASWEELHRMAKEEDPNCEGYYDPFTNMGDKFFVRGPIIKWVEAGNLLQRQDDEYFDTYALGRLLYLRTHWWGYDLDPETGIATCTGEQQK